MRRGAGLAHAVLQRAVGVGSSGPAGGPGPVRWRPDPFRRGGPVAAHGWPAPRADRPERPRLRRPPPPGERGAPWRGPGGAAPGGPRAGLHRPPRPSRTAECRKAAAAGGAERSAGCAADAHPRADPGSPRTLHRLDTWARGPHPRCGVTPLPPDDASAQRLDAKLSCARGLENRIREQQLALCAPRPSARRAHPLRGDCSSCASGLLPARRREPPGVSSG